MLPRVGFYRSLLLGFTAVWILPEGFYKEIMIKWHELKDE